jgi:hypothetical protein
MSFAHRFFRASEERRRQVRAIGLDVHLEFCEVAIADGGEVRSAGRIETKPEQRELFVRSRGKQDRVALAHPHRLGEIKRLIEPHVAQVLVVSPNDTGNRQARRGPTASTRAGWQGCSPRASSTRSGCPTQGPA